MAWGAKRGVEDLLERLRSDDPALTSLCLLRQRRFEEADAVAFAAALADNTSLRELTAAAHPVSAAAAAAFASALATNAALRSLDLGNSTFGDEGLAALAPGVAASSALRLLNLERKGITPAGCASLAAALAAAPHGGGQLEEVLLGQNDVGAEGVAALLAALRPSLRELDLSACALEGAAGAAPLAAALRQGSLPRLRSLRLNGNTLGPAAAAELAPALSDAACSLEALHVQRCGFDSGAAAALAAAAPASLQRLDLSGNALGADGGVALAAALAGGAAPALRSLLLCGCSLDDGGIAALVEALTTARKAAAGAAPASLALDLSGNTAGAAALAALAGAPLTSLCLHDCKIGGGGAAADGTADGTADGAAAAAAAVAAVVDRLAEPGAFCQLAELDVSGNRLQAAHLLALLGALTPGATAGEPACPALRLLVVAANPGASEEAVAEAIERLQGVEVVRRAADTGEGGLLG